MNRRADVTVIILAYNEEINLPWALESVVGWAREIFIVDSFSTDRTIEIAKRYPCCVVQHVFEDYANQRNFAIRSLPIQSEWIFFLDADEWIPNELRDEIASVIERDPVENGFFVKRRLMWMGRWIRRGYYPTWILRLARKDKVRCETLVIDIFSGEVSWIVKRVSFIISFKPYGIECSSTLNILNPWPMSGEITGAFRARNESL